MTTISRVLSFSLFLVSFASAALAEPCLPYEPSTVQLSGKLVRKNLPGEPEYESIAKGDRSETTWFLDLPKAICVDPGKDELQPGESDVKRVQLVLLLTASQKPQLANSVGKNVTMSGTLFHSHTGHHHSKILLSVTEME